MAQVLGNLMDNALKYGRSEDERRVCVRTRRDGGHVWIEVEDRAGTLESRLRELLDTLNVGVFRADHRDGRPRLHARAERYRLLVAGRGQL